MFSRGLWPSSCSCISQHQILSPTKRASYVTAPERAASKGFFAVSPTQSVFYIMMFLCYVLAHEFSPIFLKQSLPEIKISSPYLHYQCICVSCLQSRIYCATLLLSNVQNQPSLCEPLKKSGKRQKELRHSWRW